MLLLRLRTRLLQLESSVSISDLQRYSTVEILLNDVPVMTAFFPIIHTIPVVR